MSRKSEFQNQSPNPATKFLEWKSNDKCFSFYDKDKKENILVELPFKFLVLMQLHTVKGWNNNSESAIYSNEVKLIGQEELHVKSFKGGNIAQGLYKDVKHTIKDAGGHYVKSIYVMISDGSIINLQLKGSAVREWSEFTQKTLSRLLDEWVEVSEAKEMKKGSISYSVPVFKFNISLSDSDSKTAENAYDILKEYMSKYFNNVSEIEEVENIETEFVEIDGKEEIDPFS